MLERGDLTGHFNAAAQTGVRVGDIARHFAGDAGISVIPAAKVRAELGEGGDGPMLDQQMSAAKLMSACDWRPIHTDFRATNFAPVLAAEGMRL